jgi:hypothetical protein
VRADFVAAPCGPVRNAGHWYSGGRCDAFWRHEGMMSFERGISDKFAAALEVSKQWRMVAADSDLFFSFKGKAVTVSFEGGIIFRITLDRNRAQFRSHYKYLVNPAMKDFYLTWTERADAIKARLSEIFTEQFDIGVLKTNASSFAGPEKKGIQSILKNNPNIIDVDIDLSRDQPGSRVDFAALHRVSGAARLIFFDARRYDNSELASAAGATPPIISQIDKCRKTISESQRDMEIAYRRVCANLYRVAPDRCCPLVAEVASGAVDLVVDPEIRLAVFGFDDDHRNSRLWPGRADKLRGFLSDRRLLARSDPAGFTRGISQ